MKVTVESNNRISSAGAKLLRLATAETANVNEALYALFVAVGLHAVQHKLPLEHVAAVSDKFLMAAYTVALKEKK